MEKEKKLKTKISVPREQIEAHFKSLFDAEDFEWEINGDNEFSISMSVSLPRIAHKINLGVAIEKMKPGDYAGA